MKNASKKSLSVLLSVLLTVSVFAACLVFSANAEDVTIDVDTTGWTKVDGTNVGTWQTALTPAKPEDKPGTDIGSYFYKASKVDGKYVIEVVYNGALTGTADSFGNGNGTNVRVWFHAAKNEAGAEQKAYNALLDVAYNGTALVTRFAKNDAVAENKANWVYGYDATEKPYTVDPVIPTAKDGLYVKITMNSVLNVPADSEVTAVISVSNKPEGKDNNCLHSHTYTDGKGPWGNETWSDFAASTVSFKDAAPDTSSEASADASEAESTAASTVESTAASAAASSAAGAPPTGDLGVAAIALLAIVTAGGVFAVRKFR